MNFQPTQDRIACQLIDESITDSGLKLVSFDNREDLCQAKVLAVGPDCRYVQPDQTILVFRKPNGPEMLINAFNKTGGVARSKALVALVNQMAIDHAADQQKNNQ